MSNYERFMLLRYELDAVLGRVFELLDDLNVVELLREHTPASRRWQVDRLETALARVDRLTDDIDDVVNEAEEEAEAKPAVQ
jgi:hypothetical protein